MFALPYSKKGDLEFIETFMVILVVVVMLVMGIVIYHNVTAGNIEEASKRVSDVESAVLVNIIDSMPEVQCSIRAAPKDCVDVVKLQAFRKIVGSNRDHYYNSMGWKVVRFEQVYPLPDKSRFTFNNGECEESAFQDNDYPSTCANWTVYYRPKPNFKSKDIVRTPVSLFNPLTKGYSVGVLSVEVYS